MRQGKFAADFAYWTGDTVPYECPDRLTMRPALPRGCNADLVNTDVLMHRMTVKDGRLVLPDGVSYRYLVLPPTRDTVDPASLRKIKTFVEAGATVVLGPRPVSAAGLENYPKCDEEVKLLADAIWGPADSPQAGHRALGKGRVVWGRRSGRSAQGPMDSPRMYNLAARWRISSGFIAKPPIRTFDFVSNQSDGDKTVDAGFRVSGARPVLWGIRLWGTQRALPEFRSEKDTTVVPLRFAARQSWFVVFNRVPLTTPKPTAKHNFPVIKTASKIDGPWEVRFDPKWGGPARVTFDTLEDWTKRPEEGIKFYSGTAVYHNRFDLPARPCGQSTFVADLPGPGRGQRPCGSPP